MIPNSIRKIVVTPTPRLAFAVLLLVLSSGLAQPVPVSAQEGPFNWMREYVRLRVEALGMDVLGSRTPKAEDGTYRQRIVGGTVASAEDNPFQVALVAKFIPDDYRAHICGGTLIKNDVIVTAAHCSDFVTSSQVQVLTATRKLDGTGIRREVSKIAVHPDWNRNTYEKDVAVWLLSSSVDGIRLATIADSDGPVGENLLVTGWGDLAYGGSSPIDLRRVEVPLVARTNCNDANSYNGRVFEDMLCAGYDVGGKDACQGDSGGPLTRGRDNDVLTGITSWGYGCAEPNFFGVYTRVSDASVSNFIRRSSELDAK